MRRRVLALVSAGLCVAYAASPHAQQPSPGTAPLASQRVVLYKAGVGYFERLARVVGSGDVALQFTSRQLDDVLNSITAIDLDNGRIAGISYDSTAPIEQRLGATGVQLPLGADRAQFYAALRGARVEVTRGAIRMSGRLLGVERRAVSGDRTASTIDELTLVADDGRVRTFELTSDLTVRIVDAGLRNDVGQYLAVVGSAREQDVRHVTIATSGTGARRLLVSYISEVPVWKSTYRLVFPSGGESPLLQGWAIVDNTMAEDWTDVDLSLVAGAPQSFIQAISQPYYTRRPLVPLPRMAFAQPQTHEPTLTEVGRGDETVAANEPLRADALDAVRTGASGMGPGLGGGTGGGFYQPGVGLVAGRGGVVGASPQSPPQSPDAVGQALADLFEYHVQQPVTIRRNQSALVPILNAPVDAERVALWRPGLPDNRPLRALWLTNCTGLTLDGGSFSVMDGGAFAGEGLLDPLKPEERRLISYGTDLSLVVVARNDPASGRVTRVTARDGVVVATEEDRDIWRYTLRNADAQPRTIVIEHPIKNGWTIEPNAAAIETTSGQARFKLTLDGHRDDTFTVRERRVLQTRIAVGDFDEARLVALVQRGAAEIELRRAIAPIAAKRAELAGVEAELASTTSQSNAIVADEERLRANISALGTTKEDRALHQRYTRTLESDEDRLASLRAEVERLTADRGRKRVELSALIASLSFDLENGTQPD